MLHKQPEGASRNPGGPFSISAALPKQIIPAGPGQLTDYILRNARYPFTASYTSALLDTS